MRHYGTAKSIANRIPTLEHRGRIKFFDATKGYDFIEPANGGEDIFVHQSVLVDDHIPMKGDAVLFAAGMRNSKFGATAVKVL